MGWGEPASIYNNSEEMSKVSNYQMVYSNSKEQRITIIVLVISQTYKLQ